LSDRTSPASSAFPESFTWGTASSSHQVEGDNTRSDWWDWETQGKIRSGHTSGKALGWWGGRAEEDLSLARSFHQNAHRLSLEWSRLEPQPGVFDDAAFTRYREILGHMRDIGLRPFVTLNHFTLPQWVARRGSWLDPDLPEMFARYCAEVARRLGDLVDSWMTINEPTVLVLMSYLGDKWPPASSSLVPGAKAFLHLMQAHALGSQALRSVRPDIPVGLVHNFPLFEAHRGGNPFDRAVTWVREFAWNEAILDTLSSGRVGFPFSITGREIPGLRESIDFFGVNYYGRYEVKFDPSSRLVMGRHVQTPTTALDEESDWGQADPRGLEEALIRAHQQLEVPVFVTENGIYDADDSQRPGFLVDHLHAVKRAMDRGADVRGYFHWSLVDNFEWAEGWHTPFGLIHVDRRTGERTPKQSAHLYADICRTGALPDLPVAKRDDVSTPGAAREQTSQPA